MNTRSWTVVLHVLLLGRWANTDASSENPWNTLAQRDLEETLRVKKNTNIAKNVILFMGDGMGVSTVTGGRIYKCQLNDLPWESNVFSFESFDNVALSRTYSVDYMTPDSSSTGTAYLSGIKTNQGTLGVDQTVPRFNCSAQAAGAVRSIFDWSNDEGKSVGFVTTTRVTHATPASGYAHSADRDWESDMQLEKNVTSGNCKDIALQLVENPFLKVMLGGGRRNFLPNTSRDPEKPYKKNWRKDQRNLIEEWRNSRSEGNKNATYVWNKRQFDAVDPDKTDFLLGLFEPGHMQYELERDKTSSDTGEPSLAEMTRKAIQILQKNDKGFFLLVEGGLIDAAHHYNYAKKVLHEVMSFDDAVSTGVDMTSESDTLLVVTADHSHVFNIGGYPKRSVNILDKVTPYSATYTPADGMPKTIIVYGNGPGGGRFNLTDVDTTSKDYQFEAVIKTAKDTHSAEDVAIYAQGPMAHLFSGVHEQNYIAHVMAYASCVGMNKKHCEKKPENPGATNESPSGNFGLTTLVVVLLCSVAVINK